MRRCAGWRGGRRRAGAGSGTEWDVLNGQSLQLAVSGPLLLTCLRCPRPAARRRLSPQGPVMQAEVATHAGVFVPTNLESAWVRADGFRWKAAELTVAKVTGAV